MGKLCLFTKTTSFATQSTPDWSGCITWMDEDNPDHKHHHTYTGLAEKYGGVPGTRSQNLPA